MAYLQSIGGQVTLFLRSVGFGFLLGVLYDVLRFLRLAAGKKGILFLWDVLFGAAAGVCTFLYLLIYCDGQMRLFVFAALGAGFAAWHVFAAPAVRRRSDRFLRSVRRCGEKIGAMLSRMERRWNRKSQALAEKCTKSLKKLQKSQKTT